MRRSDDTMRARSGFTLVELCAVVFVVGAILAAIFVLLSRDRQLKRTQKDGVQVRDIHRGLVLQAQSGPDSYILPSWLDTQNTTVDGPALYKDTTSNIVSIMLYQGFFTPEVCVSPTETNPAIRVDIKYEFSNPKSAVNPAQALWDPGFNADFTAVNPARVPGFSYAHVLPMGERGKQKWNNSFSSQDAIIANRGPLVTGAIFGKAPTVVPAFDRASNTLLFHGRRDAWAGNVAYNDNSVVFEASMAPAGKFFTYEKAGPDKATGNWEDLLFYDEPEDDGHTNNFLVNVKKIGDGGPELIWD